MSHVLVCDDEAAVRFAIAEVLRERGHEVVEADTGERALERASTVDVLITDLMMPGMDGMALLRELAVREPELPVIVITARGSERAAVEAMKAGAHDYLAKPFDIEELGLSVARAIETASLKREARRARAARDIGRPMLGESAAMGALLRIIERVAPRDVTVLVRGETGTGKELVATMLHAWSSRRKGPIVRFNCAAIAPDLAEAELFGHTKGAFTGATSSRPGIFMRAHRGTLVLDEVGELPLSLQPKLLRALQQGEIQPVGAAKTEHVDVRVVACTHRDLKAESQAGTFREDLYFRLAVVELDVPPLRERREDIPLLARAFAARYAERFGIDAVRLSDELLLALGRREWRGNVRELENTIARMVALTDGGELGVEALPLRDATLALAAAAGFRARVEAFEKQLIVDALEAAGGNRSEAARQLGLSRVTLLDRMKRLAL